LTKSNKNIKLSLVRFRINIKTKQEKRRVLMSNVTLVLVESPFAAADHKGITMNIVYARACCHDCLMRGEFPFASHIFYTQTGILRDGVPAERKLGIEAGLAWGALAQKSVVYTDLGITDGMRLGIKRAEDANRPIEFRTLENWLDQYDENYSLTF